MKKYILLGMTLLLMMLGLASCKTMQKASPTPSMDPNLVYTAAAQTANARLTEMAKISVPTETPTPSEPTPDVALTVAFETISAQLTQAAALTPSPNPPQAVPATVTAGVVAGVTGDRAMYVADVTVIDGSDFAAGTAFVKTWRLKNIGTTTWTTAYSFGYISGDKMDGPNSISLQKNVAPGEMVEISVNLVAPASSGHYRGYWKLLNAEGKYFDESVYVDIDVAGSGTAAAGPTITPGGPTATPTNTPSNSTISNLSIAVDNASFSGTCPHTFAFAASFTLSSAASVTYQLEAGSETSGVTVNVPAAQTTSFGAGTQTLTFYLEFNQSMAGWARLHITSPVDVTSGATTFTLTCQP